MPVTDRSVLTARAYADERNLAARQAVYRWQRPRHNLPGEVAALLADHQGLVVDVGCGKGGYPSRLRTDRRDLTCVGMDLSVGMRPDVVADARALPLADASADAVLAMHMLYHLSRPSTGIAELARVLRPDGLALTGHTGVLACRHMG